MNYNPDTGIFTWLPRQGGDHESHRWSTRYAGRPAGARRRTGYLIICVDHVRICAAVAAWAIVHGEYPTRYMDHIDGNPNNNAIANLRQATPLENSRNRPVRKDSGSGHRGVQRRLTRKGTIRWVVRISPEPGQRLNLGSFRTQQAAIEAYARASKRHHGEFGRASAVAALGQEPTK